MKIKIIADVPTENKPEVGKEYEVIRQERSNTTKRDIFFIEVNGKEVGILSHEMEIAER